MVDAPGTVAYVEELRAALADLPLAGLGIAPATPGGRDPVRQRCDNGLSRLLFLGFPIPTGGDPDDASVVWWDHAPDHRIGRGTCPNHARRMTLSRA